MAGLGVGGAAAAGLQSGFDMGLRSDAANEARQQRAFENQRQNTADQQRADQIARKNAQEDDDRALNASNLALQDSQYQLGALHAKYGDQPIPDTEAKPLYETVNSAHMARQAILAKRYQPQIDARQKWARDIASKAEVGQFDLRTLKGQDLRDFLFFNTGNPAENYDNGTVSRGVNDVTTSLQTNNPQMGVDGANALMGLHIKQGLGGMAPDGSTIIDKNLYALVPAYSQGGIKTPAQSPVQGLAAALSAATAPPAAPPQGTPGTGMGAPSPDSPAPAGAMPDNAQANADSGQALGPGLDPNKVMPVLTVTTRQPDGRITNYHAPPTKDRRATGDNAEIAGPLDATSLMDRVGRLGVVDNWLKSPEMAQQMQDAVKAGPTTFEQAWGMVHGDPKQLAAQDPVSVQLAALKKFAKDNNISIEDASRIYRGRFDSPKGLEATLNSIADDPDSTDAEKAQARRIALNLAPKPKAGKSGAGTGTSGTGLGPAATLAGDDLLASLNPNDQAIVKGLIDGSIKPETLSVRNNHRQDMVALAARVAQGQGGTMNTNTAQVSTRTENAFAVGPESKTVRAFNTGIDHLNTLAGLATALNNSDIQGINKIKNTAADWIGDVDVSNFDGAKRIVADEVVKAIVGSGTQALGDREAAEKTIMNSKSPTQLAGMIGTYQRLMGGQLNSLGQQYQAGGGKKDFGSTFLTPAAQKFYHPSAGGMGGGAPKSGGVGAVPTATNPKTGERLQLVNGAWVPLK